MLGRIAAGLGALAATAAVADGSPVDYVVTTGGQFGTLDLRSGTYAPIGTTGGVAFEDLSRLPGTPLYGLDAAGNLRLVNTATGASTVVGNAGAGIAGLKFRPDGTLLAFSQSTLYALSPATAAATPIGPFGRTFTDVDAGFSPAGQMYLEGDSSLYTVDTTTGATRLVGPTTGFSIASTAFEDGTLYGFQFNGAAIVSIDTTTGAGTALAAPTGTVGTIFGAAPTTVPEPSVTAVVVLVTGLVTRRRRSAVATAGWGCNRTRSHP